MSRLLAAALSLPLLMMPLAATAQGYRYGGHSGVATTGSIDGRAPWHAPWQYDSGGDNDKFPARPYYQQGGGQQTGGPARNLIPYDNLTLTPR